MAKKKKHKNPLEIPSPNKPEIVPDNVPGQPITPEIPETEPGEEPIQPSNPTEIPRPGK